MKIADLQLALAVAKRGSFAAAAKEFDLDPSSASRAIADVEESLGFRLFQRSTRRLSLTKRARNISARLSHCWLSWKMPVSNPPPAASRRAEFCGSPRR